MSALGIESDWRMGGPDLGLMPFLRASWLPKIAVEAAPYPELDGPCWLWLGARDQNGYGVISIGPRLTRKFWRIHRWTAHHVNEGGCPAGFEPDHLCHRRNCFQPGHLEVVSRETNLHRMHARRFGWQEELSAADLAALSDSNWLYAIRRPYA